MSANTSITSSSGGMDKRLMQAATSGDSTSMKEMASQDPSILLGTTPSGNTCLHISSIHGHEEFCKDVITLEESLLSNVNWEGETPLVIAVILGYTSLASVLLGSCRELELKLAILQQDQYGFSALHHAIRNGHKGLAMELIAAEPALSRGVSKCNESPMFIAVTRDFTQIFEQLFEIPDSSHTGKYGRHVLHAAAISGNSVVATQIMERRPQLATEADMNGITPIRMAVIYNKVDVLRVLLEHDSSLGYEVDKIGYPLFCCAADRGQVGVARELLKHCPDAPYNVSAHNWTCLHIAVENRRPEFVEFITRTPQLQKLVNMQEKQGKTALHYAVDKCDPRLVAALLSHKNIDTTMLDNDGNSAASQLASITRREKTLDWKEVHVLMLKANTPTTSSQGGIDKQLLKAATSGDSGLMKALVASQDPSILLGTTPSGNTCLHISSVHGHERFCEDVLALEESLLTAVNSDMETPLVAAMRSGRVSLAYVLLRYCHSRQFRDAILRRDKDGCNALHHAIRSGHTELAMELIVAEPALSKGVNKYNESPMFIAAMRNFIPIFEELLKIPGSSHAGPHDQNALHAAAINGDKGNTIKIMRLRPELARKADKNKNTPVRQAVLHNKTDVLRVLLEHDCSIGSEVSQLGVPLLCSAAFRGHVDVAREILNNCPDAPYCTEDGRCLTCLHTAVFNNHTEFVKFILETPQL